MLRSDAGKMTALVTPARFFPTSVSKSPPKTPKSSGECSETDGVSSALVVWATACTLIVRLASKSSVIEALVFSAYEKQEREPQ